MQAPSLENLKQISEEYALGVQGDELGQFKEFIDKQVIPAYDEIDGLSEPSADIKYPRMAGRRPSALENPNGAWAWICRIEGSGTGLLKGKKVVIKDDIPIASLPMLNGSDLFSGFFPLYDATVVTRVLDAGGEIIGKSTCEALCASAGSHTSYPSPVRNPHDRNRMTGGSSSGNAAILSMKEADLALGTDEGGSIRIPSSWCGVYGLKPTFGLVPYTRIVDNEPTMDHVGPMARNVRDLSLLLDAIAGTDNRDPKQAIGGTPAKLPAYSESISADVKGLIIGIVKEGFGHENSEPDVDEIVNREAMRFQAMGAKVIGVSVPFHTHGASIFSAIDTEGSWSIMVRDRFLGYSWKGFYDSRIAEFYSKSLKEKELPKTVKLATLMGHYLWETYHSAYYAKAQNLRRMLTNVYDELLQKCKILVMPTTPFKAPPFPDENDVFEYLLRAGNAHGNTSVFNLTGHPALNVPCGKSEVLPVGMMLIGNRFDEVTVLSAALAYEQSGFGA